MTRARRRIALAAAVLAAASSAASPPPGPAEPALIAAFPTDAKGAKAGVAAFLERLARPPKEVRPPESRSAWDVERAHRAERLRSALGVPAAVDCRVDRVGEIAEGGVRIEKLVFWSAPRVPVPAHLYLPAAASGDRSPLVLLLHGHFDAGKSHPSIQSRARQLAGAGMAVLTMDRWGFEERRFTKHRVAHELFAAETTVLGLDVRDVECAVAALGGRADLDLERLGAVGQSGGGALAAYLGALDVRVDVVAAISALHDARGELLPGECPCNYVPRQLEVADTPDVLALVAPRPLLAGIGLRDKHVQVAVARRAAERVAATYAALGAPDAFHVEREDVGHSTGPATMRAVVALLSSTFGLAPPLPRPDDDAAPLPAERLACLGGLRAEGSAGWLTLAALAAERQREIAEEGGAPNAAADLAAVLGLRTAAIEVSRGAVVLGASLRGTPLRLQVEPEISLAGMVLEPLRGRPKSTWLWLDPRGGRAVLEEGRAIELAQRGHRVIVADLRGQGEHPGGRQDATLYLMGEMGGRPLLGQRLGDALGWLLVADGWDARSRVRVVGHGESGVLALLLACGAEDVDIASVVAVGTPLTLLAEPGGDVRWGLPPSCAVSGLTRRGDVSDIARLGTAPVLWIAPRLRDGRLAAAADPAWKRMAAARSGATFEADGGSLVARLEKVAAETDGGQ